MTGEIRREIFKDPDIERTWPEHLKRLFDTNLQLAKELERYKKRFGELNSNERG